MEGDGEGGRRSCLLCCVVFCSGLVCSVLLARLTPTRQATLVGSSTHTHTSLLLFHFTSLHFFTAPHFTSLHFTSLHFTAPHVPSPLFAASLPPLACCRACPQPGEHWTESGPHAASLSPSLVNLIRAGWTGWTGLTHPGEPCSLNRCSLLCFHLCLPSPRLSRRPSPPPPLVVLLLLAASRVLGPSTRHSPLPPRTPTQPNPNQAGLVQSLLAPQSTAIALVK
ncbi:uncharacterized protein K444DRAFT_72550 [Hyaloscypha bicolor E]|uniref:Uncharacterized protein n=1 Tax=Hyaloscypha bicolor E TaxID=1095630 RepID=A0A2J6SZ78_9HELO|nr:uncharacterized protein K444DRAFT_72550 [Hyaloscypha bicolor E]PMD56052.1 hypothetical protein K444DRAFT_72550 [Hyaloscypha bicolor E]